ncbi:MAB_1171c family putative transporter [Streptomyces sp. 12297]|uniref:MAB_1171c family putative transporter n=1 Tax=Streptomyces sp. NBC_00239 TaxID=2903640 RepID=UPI002E2B39F5|nr:MAB_1171c family putative transporter [Streptomyces sp. NBC_00239]
MDQGVNYYIPASALAVALVVKLPALLRGWRVPMVRTVNALLLMACAGLTFSAPPTITVVNRLTGVSNFSAPLVYSILCVYSCSALVMMENWRADSRHQEGSRRRVRRWMLAYGLVVVAIIGCFVLGEAPDERLRDFDTYYSTTPYIREMIVLYLLAHIVAACATTVFSWKWALDIAQEARKDTASTEVACLRAGLVILVVGFGMSLLFGVVKLTGVLTHSELLNEGVAPFVSLAALVAAAGFLVPVFGPRLIGRVLRPWRTYRALAPLRQVVEHHGPAADQPVFLELPWYAGPEQRLVHRVTSIQDCMLRLRPYFDDDVRADASRQAEGGGADEAAAAAAGFATMLRAAAAARVRGEKSEAGTSSRAALALREAESVHRDLVERISRTLRHIPEPAVRHRAEADA